MKAKLAALSASMMLLAGAFGAATPAKAGVTINALFNAFTCTNCGIDPSTVVSLQGNSQAQGAILAATQQVGSQFNNNLTANIAFFGVHAGTDGFLAESESGQTVYNFSQYAAALGADAAAHPANAILNSAVANLGVGNGANRPLMVVNTTDARLLGLGAGVTTAFGPGNATPQFDSTGDFLGANGSVDGIVLLNLDQPLIYSGAMPAYSNPPGPLYDAQSAMEHEIDEVMGIGGSGSQLNNFNFDPSYAQDFYGVNGPLLGVMDLYRYSAPGVGSFDPTTTSITGCTNLSICSGLASPYFSVDGGLTPIDTFNQAFPLLGGDAGDWGLNLSQNCAGGDFIGGTGDVQDAFSCNNLAPNVSPGRPSFKAFESIGYNPVPEPAAWTMILLGFAGMGVVLRRRTAVAATA